jgi:hypothetical protein
VQWQDTQAAWKSSVVRENCHLLSAKYIIRDFVRPDKVLHFTKLEDNGHKLTRVVGIKNGARLYFAPQGNYPK